jgi:hypothetical protein
MSHKYWPHKSIDIKSKDASAEDIKNQQLINSFSEKYPLFYKQFKDRLSEATGYPICVPLSDEILKDKVCINEFMNMILNVYLFMPRCRIKYTSKDNTETVTQWVHTDSNDLKDILKTNQCIYLLSKFDWMEEKYTKIFDKIGEKIEPNYKHTIVEKIK